MAGAGGGVDEERIDGPRLLLATRSDGNVVPLLASGTAAAGRGVRVELLLQGVADHPFLQLATRALYDQLLHAGVTIYEYDVAMLHGKIAVVDDRWATVGSSNLDPFSLVLNREANVVAVDETFAKTLRTSVEEEIAAHARRCHVADWQHRGWWSRVKSWAAFQFFRLVGGVFGLKHD